MLHMEGREPTLCHLPNETLRVMSVRWTERTIRVVRATGRWGQVWHQLEGACPARIRRWVHHAAISGQGLMVADTLSQTPIKFEGRRWIEMLRLCVRLATSSPYDVAVVVLDLACKNGETLPHLYCSDTTGSVEIMRFGKDTIIVPDLSLMPDVHRLIFEDCPMMRELPGLPGRVGVLHLLRLPVLERLPDIQPPDHLMALRVIGATRLRHVPRKFVDFAARTIVFESNPVLEELPLMRQRRGRAKDFDPPTLRICQNERLIQLPPSFAGGWRVDQLQVSDNPRLVSLPPWFGSGVQARRVVISENNSLVWVNTGFLKRARCQRLKITENPMLASLPEGMDLVVSKMTVADSNRLKSLPHDLGRRGVIAHLKVHSNKALRSIWSTRAIFSGQLEVYNNDALRIIAPRITFGGAPSDDTVCGKHGMRVCDNPNLVCLAQVLDGRLPGALNICANASLSALTTGSCQIDGLLEVDITYNEQLRGIDGLLCNQGLSELRITHNSQLRSMGETNGLHVSGNVFVCDNPNLTSISLGSQMRVGKNVEVSGNSQLMSLTVGCGTKINGQMLVRSNSALTEVHIAPDGTPAHVGSLWVIDNSALRQLFSKPVNLEVTDDLLIVRNLKLRHLSPRQFSFVGHVAGDIVVSENPRLRTVHHAILAAARGGIHITENARLKKLPRYWAADGLQLTAKVRILNNAMLESLGDVVDVRAYLGFKVVNNQALREVSASMLRVSTPAGNIRMSFNQTMERLAGGIVDIQAGGSCTITHNPRMMTCTPQSMVCAAQRDIYLEYNTKLETLGSNASLKAGHALILQQNYILEDVDISAVAGQAVKLSH
jgi:hypothetical protein